MVRVGKIAERKKVVKKGIGRMRVLVRLGIVEKCGR